MADKTKNEKKALKHRNKNDLPVFDTDHDFLIAFEKKVQTKPESLENNFTESFKKNQKNKHGVKVMDPGQTDHDLTQNHENFSQLLEESFKKRKVKSLLLKSTNIPL